MSSATTTSTASLFQTTRAHAGLNFREVIREPIAIIGTTVFPAIALLFFVVPQAAIANDPEAATMATVQMAAFAVMSVYLFNFGAGVSEDRARPFDTFLRSLPAGPLPQLLGRLATAGVMAVLGLIPIAVIASFLTEATLPFGRLLLTGAMLMVGGIPLMLLGFTVGYIFSQKAAIAIVQLLFFGLAFAGGMLIPPMMFPDWLNTLSQALPSRGMRDLVVWGSGVESLGLATIATLAGWTVVIGAVTWWAYRRDEGRRFR